MTRLRIVLLAHAVLGAALLAAGVAPATAQSFPNRLITIVSPAPAGGITDTIGRALAQRFQAKWGQQAVVENKPGANNQIAAEFVLNQPADGHTLFIAPDSTFVANPSLYPKLPYDPYKSFTPISGLVIINHGLIAHPSFPPNSVKEFIELAKSKPGEINYGTYGIGSSGHLNMLLFESMTGTKMQPVHYKGAAPATNDVIAGHIPIMFVSAASGAPLWKDGKLKYFAVGGSKRLPQLPDIPTVADTVPGYEGISWFALVGPAGIPAEIVAKINAEVRAMFADPEMQKNFVDRFMLQPMLMSPEELMAFIRKEEPKWRKVITEAKLKVE